MNENIFKAVSGWLAQQPFTNVLLVLILAAGGYGLVYVVPSHIQQLNDGFMERMKLVAEKFDRDQDRDHEMYLEILRHGRVERVFGLDPSSVAKKEQP